ncbi:hypothetical protein COO60DRAFT_261018 [Scenedesmus sp. NREL 46B-D3]|nr:hypothetical protein COO60DRAFT_261018 [Scenedesmus sp. NREL 46B-D3]
MGFVDRTGRRPLLLLALVALLLAHRAAAAAAASEPDEKLTGWLGETYKGAKDAAADSSGMRVLSWDPRIMHYRRFLSESECDELREMARPQLQRSGVADSITGKSKYDKVRTSSGMFFPRGQNELVKSIEERVAMVTMLPADNAEGMQVLHYENGQEYRPHHDYFSFAERDKNGGNRMATVLMYLTDVAEGGETVFPHTPKAEHQTLENGWSNCSLEGLAVKPKKGDATIFWSIRPDGTFDHKSLHGSCPVIKGEKWSATKWIHVAHFAAGSEVPKEVKRVIYAPPPPPIPAWCKDENKAKCSVWAESGECMANPGFMIGDKNRPGSCLASCGRCDLLPDPTTAGGQSRKLKQ